MHYRQSNVWENDEKFRCESETGRIEVKQFLPVTDTGDHVDDDDDDDQKFLAAAAAADVRCNYFDRTGWKSQSNFKAKVNVLFPTSKINRFIIFKGVN